MWFLERNFYDRSWPIAVIEISSLQSFDFSHYRRDGTDESLAAMLQSVGTSAKSSEKSLIGDTTGQPRRNLHKLSFSLAPRPITIKFVGENALVNKFDSSKQPIKSRAVAIILNGGRHNLSTLYAAGNRTAWLRPL